MAIGVTLLIIYVMNPPISDAVQGAYVVAVVGTGALLGGGGLVFKDITECLGCLLGGFCLSMWILTLKEGGLLGAGGSDVIIFITVFSAAGFIGYFSRWTRSYYMIVCISLGGATAIVIGIDCFSRAGLKEYWAWIWDLNKDLFPLGADTYPLTRGIRVEQALTILLTSVGIISQMKLWRIIKEHRAKKEEQRLEAEAASNEHEANVGRDIERANALERRQWEAVYGDPKSSASVHKSPDSAVGDMDGDSKPCNSETTATFTTTHHSTINEGDQIELADIPAVERTEGDHWTVIELDEVESKVSPKPKSAAEKSSENDEGGTDTARVTVDEVDGIVSADASEDEKKVWLIGEDGEARLVTMTSAEQSRLKSGTPMPNPVALPRKAPQTETDAIDDDGQTSVAAVADEDGEMLETRGNGSKRSSFAKRSSTGLVDLSQRVSQQRLSQQSDSAAHGNGANIEVLTISDSDKDDNESVAATFDDSSDGEANDIFMTPVDEQPFSMETQAEMVSNGLQDEKMTEPASNTREGSIPDAMTVSNETVSEKQDDSKQEELVLAEDTIVSKDDKATTTEAESGPVSLTRDRLPRGLSRIALSYRTNEWAKHLSNAEMPPSDERQFPFPPQAQPEETKAMEELAAPVNVDELRKTAVNATPPPAMPRSASAMSIRPSNSAISGSKASGKAPAYSQTNLRAVKSQVHLSSQGFSDSRGASGRLVEAIAEEDDNGSVVMGDDARMTARRAAAAALAGEEDTRASLALPGSHNTHAAARPISSRPPIVGVISYDSPQTLIGKRDMLMRVKNAALRPDSVQAGAVGNDSPNASATVSDADSVRSVSDGAAGAQVPHGPSKPKTTGNGLKIRRSSDSANMPSSYPVDPDDLPLSQRKVLIRQSSMASVASGNNSGPGPRRSSLGHNPIGGISSSNLPAASAIFNSHQPQRAPNVPTQAERNSQLASFRQSVQQDLRATPLGLPVVHANANAQPGRGAGGGGGYHIQPQGAPLIDSVYGIPGTSSTNSLPPHLVQQSHDAEVQRDMEVQRRFLMGQRQAEAQRREALRGDRELAGRMFEQRIRTDGEMLDLHRRAMRRIQRSASQADQQQQ